MIDPQVIEYIVQVREESLDLMINSESYETFFYYKGKVYAYNEMLRVLIDDE